MSLWMKRSILRRKSRKTEKAWSLDPRWYTAACLWAPCDVKKTNLSSLSWVSYYLQLKGFLNDTNGLPWWHWGMGAKWNKVEKHKVCIVAYPPPNQLQMISLGTLTPASDWWRKKSMPHYWPSGYDGESSKRFWRMFADSQKNTPPWSSSLDILHVWNSLELWQPLCCQEVNWTQGSLDRK